VLFVLFVTFVLKAFDFRETGNLKNEKLEVRGERGASAVPRERRASVKSRPGSQQLAVGMVLRRNPRINVLRLFLRQLLFNRHIAEFAGVEDLAAELALYEFGVFIARDNAHAWVLAVVRHLDSR